MAGRILKSLGAILIVAASGFVVFVAYQFSASINKPLPPSAENWTDQQVEVQTRRYVYEGTIKLESKLQTIPERTQQALLNILAENPENQDFCKQTPGIRGRYKSPLSRICNLLQSGKHSIPAIPLLLPFLDSKNDEESLRAAIQLAASTGHENSLPFIERGLSSPSILKTTLDRLEYPILDGTISPKIEPRIWPKLKELVTSSGEPRMAAVVMIELNEQRANQFLTSPELFGFHNRRFGQILSAYDRANVLINRELLLPQIDQLETQTDEVSRPFYSYQLLVHLGLWEHPADHNLLTKLVEHEDETIAENAAEALLCWHDIPYGNVDLDKAADVPSAVSIRNATDTLRYMAGEYGFLRYFRSEKGDNWRFARQGLIEIEATRSAAVFDAAVGVFGNIESAISKFEREPSVDELSSPELTQLKALSHEWTMCNERLEVKLALYMIKHKEVFQEFERIDR